MGKLRCRSQKKKVAEDEAESERHNGWVMNAIKTEAVIICKASTRHNDGYGQKAEKTELGIDKIAYNPLFYYRWHAFC